MLPPATPPPRLWHAIPATEVLRALEVTPAGLSESEVVHRRSVVGPNRFQALKPASLLSLVVRQFRSILVLLLIVAAAISITAGDRADAIAIAAVLVLNGLIGFLTEWRARRAMEGLLALEVGRARVIRSGVMAEISADDLVPGDIIDLEAGHAVPADARLLACVEFEVAEAALTGESFPVQKDAALTLPEHTPLPARTNLVYKATTVMSGHGRAVVIATGMGTEVGRIGALAASVHADQTPLERRLEALGRPLALAAVGTAVLVALVALLRGAPLGLVVQTAIALAVAAVPEGLPAVATITLAIGVRRMARRHALVRHLPSVETLGSTTVICTDKTGTLTTGIMTATTIRLADREITLTGDPGAPHATFLEGATAIAPRDEPRLVEALRVGSLANRSEVRHDGSSWTAVGDPTEAALLVAAHRAGLDPETFRAEWPEVGEIAFSSTRRIMATFHAAPDGARRLRQRRAGPGARLLLQLAYRIRSRAAQRPEPTAAAGAEQRAGRSRSAGSGAGRGPGRPAGAGRTARARLRGAGRHDRPARPAGSRDPGPVPYGGHTHGDDHGRSAGHGERRRQVDRAAGGRRRPGRWCRTRRVGRPAARSGRGAGAAFLPG